MQIINQITQSYLSFFSMDTLQALASPVSWGLIMSLVILEGLLSSDNAIVLAAMVKHLPVKQRKKALFYGLIGAYTFRFLAIGLGTFLVKMWWIKVLGGIYLLYIALRYFLDKADDGKVNNKQFGFWGTVVAVELMDITFSVDSILAAFGVSEQPWILFIGGVLGILMMRGVAQLFLKLIDKVGELETAAYVVISVIGVKMIGSKFFEINHVTFFAMLVVIFSGAFIVHYVRQQKIKNATV